MAFPESLADFAQLVDSMRTLGVVSAFGVVLGPPPAKVVALEKAAETAAPGDRERLNKELADEEHRLRVERARADMRLQLAASGREYSDEEIDHLTGPVT